MYKCGYKMPHSAAQVDLLRHGNGDMPYHADVGQRRRIAVTKPAGILVAGQMSLQRGQRFHDPVPPPRCLLRVAQIEFVVEIAPHPRRQQRMALAGHHQRQRTHAGAAVDIGGQQRRGGVFLVEIFEDGERLEQRGAVILDQRRQRHLRIDLAILGVTMRVGVEVDEDHLGRNVFQIERDADAKARQRSPEGEEFHGGEPRALRHART